MLREEQIDIRRQRARAGRFRIENLGKKRVFSEYRVTNPESGGQYTVTVHGFDVGDNACTCPDFKSNTLGTCKHIEAVLENLKDDLPAHLQKKKATITRPEVYLHYGDTLQLALHLPQRHSDKLGQLAKRFFDEKWRWSGRGRYEDFIPAVEAVPEDVTVMSDALDFVDSEISRAEMAAREKEWVDQLAAGSLDLNLLPVPLYDYQTRGALFLACRGRTILGDDMGLGKTIQTLAAVELLARERGVSRVLVVAPASVKYQWESEIRKFTRRAVQIIDGSPDDRKDQYAEVTFYRLVNYEQVVRDREAINAWKPDVIVLDEAQRIKNWESKTSKEVKKLKSRYAIVLTGTPLENKLEELYSIVQFVDERRFGPAFQFLHDHRVLDENGNLTGYRNLDKMREKLEPIFLRRTRGEVLTQLPSRTDNTVFVELAEAQRVPYEDQRTTLARLLQKGHLTDLDRKRVLACIVNMRMLCDSTFLFDKQTNTSPKLAEFAELIPELLAGEDHKVVAFSQWETMILKAAEVLDGLGVAYVILHGGLAGKDRKAVLEQFNTDPECRVFLSTDAGGTGLNLQVADTVVNLELPWNPAVLEQRIARVHRMGQSRPVRVVNLVTRGTIEERVLRTLESKQSLFAGVFDGDEDEIAFTGATQPKLFDAVRELVGEPKPESVVPAVEQAVPAPAAAIAPSAVVVASVQMLEAVVGVLTADMVRDLAPDLRARIAAAAAALGRVAAE
ncbi:DEAD/DEAH box helicase [Fimbriiglobus ruber]|uniref:Putative helicase n=1 Tax=Fimbriiglobus ruber TaxID=1908690 RepID=A0A225E7E7_9BACT|nr:DEAD/DEAH box helicase [Fimbriiglobus ruber]OWK44357.1 putative helicase [Fimbriiglobus ruber]